MHGQETFPMEPRRVRAGTSVSAFGRCQRLSIGGLVRGPRLRHSNAGGFMQRSTRSLDGILARAIRSSRFALIGGLALSALALGCTEPSAPVATDRKSVV